MAVCCVVIRHVTDEWLSVVHVTGVTFHRVCDISDFPLCVCDLRDLS